MKVKYSPLEIVDFNLLQLNIVFNSHDEGNDSEISEIFKKYDVEMDFAISSITEDLIQVFMKAGINHTKKMKGYSIFAECTCIFNLNSDKLNEAQISNLKVFSPLYISLNCLRSNIADVTSKFPHGKYILPSIDLNALILEKQATRKKTIVKKAAKKKTDK